MLVAAQMTADSMPRGPRPKNVVPDWALALKMRRLQLGNLTQEDIQSRSGDLISQGTVSDLERGKVALDSLNVRRAGALARALNWTLIELQEATGVDLGLGAHMDSAQTRQVYGDHQQQPVFRLSGLIEKAPQPVEYAWLPPGAGDDAEYSVALLVEDTDMERMGRSLHPDDIIFVRTDRTTPIADHLYAIEADSKVVIRRFIQTPIGAAFAADNPSLAGQLLSPDKVKILGHVYRVFSDFNNFAN